MKESLFRIAILSFICLMLIFSPAGAQKTKIVNGVTVVLNGKKPTPPKGQSGTLKLIEEQTFGRAENPEESFSLVTAFAVDAVGTVFGLDQKDCDVKVFDRSGKFLRRIGKPGQGPGELRWPANIHLTKDDNVLINDPIYGKLSIFKSSGEHMGDVSTTGKIRFNILSMDSDGNFLGSENRFSSDNNKIFFDIKKYDSSLNPLFTLDSIEYILPPTNSKSKENAMETSSVFLFDGSGNIFSGRNNAYEIKVYNPEGKHIRTIQKDFSSEKITQQDIDSILERMSAIRRGGRGKDLFSFPEAYPPFQDFILDDQGRLYVRTFAKGKAKGEWMVDVFDPEGRFIAQFSTRAELRLIKEGKAYGIEETEEGFRLIKRYAIAWQ